MKIIKRKSILPEELPEQANLLKFELPETATEEEAKEKNLKVYVNTDFKQVVGKEAYNFIFLKAASRRVYNECGEITGRIYIISLWTEGELIEAEMPQEEYSNGKWLKKLNTLSVLFMPSKDYRMLIKAFQPKDDGLFYFEKIGIQRLDDKYYYAASNCAVSADGIKWDVRALQEGFNLNPTEGNLDPKAHKTKTIESFMKYNSWSFDVFFPIHCIPLLSVLQYFLKMAGGTAGAVLWIDGKVGSGKTQLSMTMGDFFNRGSRQGISSHVNSPKAKYNEICENLPKYRNAVFILDDIKKEESSRNRENSKNITDLLIRSIYKGKLDSPNVEGTAVDVSAIVNGEFFKEQASTTSRILYLQINNFLNQKDNSAHFKEIQENPCYLADFMCLFLIWLLKKMKDEQEIENMRSKLDSLKDAKSLTEIFLGEEIGSRMIETVANFQIVSVVLDEFFEANGIPENRREKFLERSKQSLLSLGRATYLRSLNYLPMFKQMLIETLPKLNIKDCRYGKKYLSYAADIEKNPDYYYDNLPLITAEADPSETSREESLGDFGKICLFGIQEQYDGILFKRDESETLLVRTDVICRLLREKIIEYNEKNPSPLPPSQYTDASILEKLADSQTIYGYKRNDGFRKIINFPVFSVNDNYANENPPDDYIYISDEYSMVKINTDEFKCSRHPTLNICVLKDFIKMAEKFMDFRRHGGISALIKNVKALQGALSKVDLYADLK